MPSPWHIETVPEGGHYLMRDDRFVAHLAKGLSEAQVDWLVSALDRAENPDVLYEDTDTPFPEDLTP